jgi:formamidopyrimidine-DNA glycosylase
MPELPEVETTVRALRQPLVGRVIMDVWNDWPKHLTPTLSEFQQRIQGKCIQAVDRRAKYLVFRLSEGETLLIHLKMTGHLAVVAPEEPADKHVHTLFTLDDGRELRFRDTRKFGRVYLLSEAQTVLGKLGPEPLSEAFTPEILHQKLQGRKRVLKPLLLDQEFIAGIGNIYADEALHHAGIHPMRISNTLSMGESRALHAAIQKVLELGIRREGASIDNYRKPDGSGGDMQNALVAYNRAGELCYRCKGTIERIVLGGRSTHFCSGCQS